MQFVKNLAPDGLQAKSSDQLCIIRVGRIQAHIFTMSNNTVTNENYKYCLDNDRLLHFEKKRVRLKSAPNTGIPSFYTV